MPKDSDKYYNPQKCFTAFESEIVLRKKFKSKDLTKKGRKILLKERSRLLDQAEKEFNKPTAPPNLFSREQYKFVLRSYWSYIDELEWDTKYYQKPIRDPIIKELRRRIYGSTLHQKLNDTMRMFRIHYKKFQLIKKFKLLELTDKQEAKERDMGLLYQIFDSYLISKYASQRIKGFEVTMEHGKVTVKRPDLNALEAQMENYALIKSILDRTILISAALQDKSLSEDKRNVYIKKREKLREDLKFTMMYEIRREHQNGENFENFRKECGEAYKNLMKVIDLYLEILGPYRSKRSTNVKTDVTMKEIKELGKILAKSDLTIEERKYFLQRMDLLEKEIDWEGRMKKLFEDFPYEKGPYFPKMD